MNLKKKKRKPFKWKYKKMKHCEKCRIKFYGFAVDKLCKECLKDGA